MWLISVGDTVRSSSGLVWTMESSELIPVEFIHGHRLVERARQICSDDDNSQTQYDISSFFVNFGHGLPEGRPRSM